MALAIVWREVFFEETYLVAARRGWMEKWRFPQATRYYKADLLPFEINIMAASQEEKTMAMQRPSQSSGKNLE